MGSALVLVPTRRHADQFRNALGTGIEPHVINLQEFADELIRVNEPALRPNTDIDRRLLLDSILVELRERELPYFHAISETRGFFDAADGYITELTEAGVDYRALLKVNARRRKGVTGKQTQAARIFELYQSRLASSRRIDPPQRLDLAARLWVKDRREPFKRVRSVYLAGFTEFTAGQQLLLIALRETVEHLWIAFPASAEPHTPEFVRQWVTKSVGPSEWTYLEPVAASGPVASSPATSRHLIEAAGELGEARLVARRVRRLLAEGVRAERILVIARNFTPSGLDLFREVFEEYDIPYDDEQAGPFARAPAVAFLLRSLRLPEENWEFARVAAVLRSSYFRPNWDEIGNDPELPAKVEALLRMLGETRGRDAYLKAIATWVDAPPEPLEDEDIEEPLRQKKQQLAIRCRPFMDRFFATWDKVSLDGPAETAVAGLKAFAEEIGLSRVRPSDLTDLERFWSELDRWAKREATSGTRKPLEEKQFARVLATVASSPCREAIPRGGRVMLLSAKSAAGLDCDYLFLVGLGEEAGGSIPPVVARRPGASASPECRLSGDRQRALTRAVSLRHSHHLTANWC